MEVMTSEWRELRVFNALEGKHVVCATEGHPISLPDELRVRSGNAFTYVPPPASYARSKLKQATINVSYEGFTPEAQAAFQFAVDIWASQITSDVPIEVEASFESLPTGVLGAAGPALWVRNWTTGHSPPRKDTWYPIALANILAGVDLIPSSNTELPSHDITARFSRVRSDWYFGTDGNTPAGKIDFVSVVLHELGHGLGFSGTATVFGGEGRIGSQGALSIYDVFVENNAGEEINNFPNPSTALAAQLQGGNLFFNAPDASAANGGQHPELYAPNPWRQGSSYSHLDETVFGPGDINSLMSPSLSSAEAIHDPGPITRGIFNQMGWSTSGGTTPTSTPTTAPTSTPTATVRPTLGPTWTATATPTKTASPTPTITPGGPTFTPTPTPRTPPLHLPIMSNMPTPIPLLNGDFEAGSVAWKETSQQGWALILERSYLPVAHPPRRGSWALWLGGDDNEIAYIAQQVTVLSNTPYLSYWH